MAWFLPSPFSGDLPKMSGRSSQSPFGVRWRRLMTQGSLWLATEIVMGSLGLDTIADYSEFLLQSRAFNSASITIAQVIPLIQ